MPKAGESRSSVRRSDSPLAHARVRRRTLALCLPVAACLIAWPLSRATAESAEVKPVDPCALLTNELETIAKQAVGKLPEKDRPKELNPNNTIRYAVNDLATKLAPFPAEISNKRLASGNLVWVTFEGESIRKLTDADASKVCIQVYVPAESKPAVSIQQVTLIEKDQAKRLKVVFKVETQSTHWYWPWANVDYVVFGVIPTSTPTETKPTFFSYRTTVTVAADQETWVLSLLFVAAAYIFLAWTTYPEKEDVKKSGEPKDGKKPDDAKKPDDLKELMEGKWLLFALSPVRISAAWFGEASMSQLQVLVFTFVVAGLMLFLFLRTGALSEVSMDLLKLIGISALGTAGAKFTQTLKTGLKTETARFLIGKGWYQWELRPIQHTATFHQLLLTDNRLDVYKFQMLIFTVIVAFYVMSAGQAGLGGVTISDTMLYLIGISQVVYVGGKAVTDRTTDLEEAVAKMRDLEMKLKDPKTTPDEQKEARAEYERAAETAVVEFAFLQNRIYPRANQNDPNSKPDPKILVPPPGLASAS